MADNNQSIGDFFSELGEAFHFKDGKINMAGFVEDLGSAVSSLTSYSTEINKTFGQTRQRITEIQTTLADTLPGITRLGGGMKDVQETLSSIAEESNRNVLATTTQTEKLYAAFKVTGESVKTLVKDFTDVGVGLTQMNSQIEKSVNYIQSIGGNTQQVFKIVTANMEQLNRYQFDGGVEGLTKMAAQASMLRFNMNETFRLADRVLTPEGAVETAAAFQRLGLAVGGLGDPFQLMNQSINDPSGLQDSLANVAKQFTYFDDKTKTFKINPQGVLTLKELEKQTGVSASEMSKLGLAAKEADQRISAINAAGLNVKEEDRTLLANIARMGDGGQYEVEVKDKDGKQYYEKLTNLTQDQLDATIKQQKDGPKTLEDIARAQMNYSEVLVSDVKAIKDKVVYGLASPRAGLEGLEGIGRLVTNAFSGELSKAGKTDDYRKVTETAIEDIKGLFKDIQSGKGFGNSFANLFDKVNDQSKTMGADFKKGMDNVLDKIYNKIGDKTYGESLTKDLMGQLMGKDNTKGSVKTNETKPSLYNQLNNGGATAENLNRATSTTPTTNITATKSQVDFAGGLKVDVKFTGAENFSQQQLEQFTKIFNDKMNSTEVQTLIRNIITSNNPTKAPLSTSIGNK
jgi:hypothetical protein